MRLAVAAAIGSLALGAPGDQAIAAFHAGVLTLTLRYEMTCGQPGPGPLAVFLPSGIRIGSLRAMLNGKAAQVSHHGRTVDVMLPKPPPVTCMSITEGTLRVGIRGLHASSGAHTLRAQVNRHSFNATFRVS